MMCFGPSPSEGGDDDDDALTVSSTFSGADLLWTAVWTHPFSLFLLYLPKPNFSESRARK